MQNSTSAFVSGIQDIERMDDPKYLANDEAWQGLSDLLIDNMYMYYNTGKRHREAEVKQWSHMEFASHFYGMAKTLEHMPSFIKMYYAGYNRGFKGLDGKHYC